MKFTLVVYPNGSSILATEGDLTQEQIEHIREAFDIWKKQGEGATLVVGRMNVVTALDIELDLEES